MNIHSDKTQENKSQSDSSRISNKKSNIESIFQFADNRPEANSQRKLHEIANKYQQSKPMT